MMLAGARGVCCLLQQQKPSWSTHCARMSPLLAPIAQFGAETWTKHPTTPLAAFFAWFGAGLALSLLSAHLHPLPHVLQP